MVDQTEWEQVFPILDDPLSENAIVAARQLGATPEYVEQLKAVRAAGRLRVGDRGPRQSGADLVTGQISDPRSDEPDVQASLTRRDMKSSSTNRPSVVSVALARIGGLDRVVARSDHPYRSRYATLGILLLVRSFVVLVAVWSWLSRVIDAPGLAPSVGLAAAGLTVVVGRSTVFLGRRRISVGRILYVAIGAILALVIAVMAAQSISMRLFSREVDEQIVEISTRARENVSADIEKQYSQELQSLDGQIVTNEAQLLSQRTDLANEVDGAGQTGVPGFGQKASLILHQVNQLQADHDALVTKRQRVLSLRDSTIAARTAGIDHAIGDSYLIREEAFSAVLSDQGGARTTFWVIMIVMVLLQLFPGLYMYFAREVDHDQDALLRVSGLLGEAEREIRRVRSNEPNVEPRPRRDSGIEGESDPDSSEAGHGEELSRGLEIIAETHGRVASLAEARARRTNRGNRGATDVAVR